MSWSFSATGRPKAVAEKAKAYLAGVKCAEPEESIKNKIGNIIDMALMSFPESGAVKITCNGTQSPQGTFALNSVRLEIEPLWGFVE